MKTSILEKKEAGEEPCYLSVDQHIIEIVSDSGEGAQTCGQTFGALSAKMGNGVWTVEIIPAEIEPPSRSGTGASGNRIQLGTRKVTNAGDKADLVVPFNEQVLYSRIDAGALKEGTLVFLDNIWSESPDKRIQEAYSSIVSEFRGLG